MPVGRASFVAGKALAAGAVDRLPKLPRPLLRDYSILITLPS